MVTSHITDRLSGTWATSLMLHNRGRGHFRFWKRMWRHPRWRTEAEMPPAPVMEHQARSLYYFYRLTSLLFHVNRPSHYWDTTFSKADLENPGSRSWVRWTLKVTTWAQHSIDSHPFRSMPIGHPIPERRLFQNLTLTIQGQGHGWGQSWKSQSRCNIISIHIPFVPCQSTLSFLRYNIF